MRRNQYFIYIMSSKSGTLYLGMTNNLPRRTWEHKQGLIEGFPKKYGCTKLVYFEEYGNVNEAIAREKQLKNWRRGKKEWLIRKLNPSWKDIMMQKGFLGKLGMTYLIFISYFYAQT